MKIQQSRKVAMLAAAAVLMCGAGAAPAAQKVEGFDKVVFHYASINDGKPLRDFRGDAPGFMTAPWWMPGLKGKPNTVSWQTAAVPAKEQTTFSFIGASSFLPPQFARGPEAKLFVNGNEVLSFTIGTNRDFTWKNGDYQLRYLSKRVEFPFIGSHRELRELNGDSGAYELTVPADAVTAGQPVELKVELQPFDGWDNGWFMVKERKDVLTPSLAALQGQIDALQQDMARSNELTQILATQVYAKALGTDGFEHEVIYQNGFRHVHPADLISLKNGDLLLMWREGTEHISIDGDVVMLRSKDHGKTWGDRQVIAGIPNLDEREGCGVQLADGTIVVGIFFNNLYGNLGTYKPPEAEGHPHPDMRALGTYIITSKDDGHTWSAPAVIDTAGMPFKNMEGPTDAPIAMPDGSILMAVIGYGIDGDAKNTGAVMLRSGDAGKSWSYLSTIAGDPGGKLGQLVEPGIVRTRTGRIVAAMRNEGPDHPIYLTWSDDEGKTWVPVKKTSLYGGPVDLVQLSDGRIMATYGVRPVHSIPAGIRACFSSDNGETFDLKTEVQLRSDFVNWDVGYPESLELSDGRVLSVYYYNMFDRYFIGGTFWKPTAKP